MVIQKEMVWHWRPPNTTFRTPAATVLLSVALFHVVAWIGLAQVLLLGLALTSFVASTTLPYVEPG